MNQVLKSAADRQCCIGAFDTPSLEILMAVLGTAEKRNEPVIVQHAQLHECEIPIDVIRPHHGADGRGCPDSRMRVLDHGEDIAYVKKALSLGFSAVMIDGSSLSYEDNVRLTREVTTLAKEYNADVEAEIGIVTGHEGRVFGYQGCERGVYGAGNWPQGL